MNYKPLTTEKLNSKEVADAVIKFVSNQRKCDKFSVAYMCGMMSEHYLGSAEFSTRKYWLDMFIAKLPTRIQRLNNGYCLTEVFSQFQTK